MTTEPARPLIATGHHGLPLPGWDRYSIWGLDPVEAGCGRLYAHLWRNNDDGRRERPRFSLTEISDLPTLARRIVMVTGCTEDAVARAVLRSLGTSSEPDTAG